MEWVRLALLLSSTYASVVDGDTLRLADGGPNVRLQGYNAPETFQPHCVKEKAAGEAAKARLAELLRRPDAALTLSGGSCAFGRRCGTLTIAGRNVGEILISQGLAEPMVCVGGRCPPPRDWCNG